MNATDKEWIKMTHEWSKDTMNPEEFYKGVELFTSMQRDRIKEMADTYESMYQQCKYTRERIAKMIVKTNS